MSAVLAAHDQSILTVAALVGSFAFTWYACPFEIVRRVMLWVPIIAGLAVLLMGLIV